MSEILDGSEHIWSEGCEDRCGACNECNLSICTVCGDFEGGLATHCPGKGNPPPDGLDVYKGQVDFRAGKWRVGMRNRGMLWKAEEAIEVERYYLYLLKAECADPKYVQDAIDQIVKWQNAIESRLEK